MKHLDKDSLTAALYVTSPTGLRQLATHLEQQGITFTPQLLEQLLADMLRSSKVIHRMINFGGEAVGLYGLPGTWSG